MAQYIRPRPADYRLHAEICHIDTGGKRQSMWSKRRAQIFNEFLISVQKVKQRALRCLNDGQQSDNSEDDGEANAEDSSECLERGSGPFDDTSPLLWIPSCREAAVGWRRRRSSDADMELIVGDQIFPCHTSVVATVDDDYLSGVCQQHDAGVCDRSDQRMLTSVHIDDVPPRWAVYVLRTTYGFAFPWHDCSAGRAVLPLAVIHDVVRCAAHFKNKELRATVSCLIKCLIVVLDQSPDLGQPAALLTDLSEPWWTSLDHFLLLLNKHNFHAEYLRILDHLEAMIKEIVAAYPPTAGPSASMARCLKEGSLISLLLQYHFLKLFYPQLRHRLVAQLRKEEKQRIVETHIPDLESDEHYRHVSYKSLRACAGAITQVAFFLETCAKVPRVCPRFLKLLRHFYTNLRYAVCDDLAEVVLWSVTWTAAAVRPHPFWRDIPNGVALHHFFVFSEALVAQWRAGSDARYWKFEPLPPPAANSVPFPLPRLSETVLALAGVGEDELEALSAVTAFPRPLDLLQEMLELLLESCDEALAPSVTWTQHMRRQRWRRMFCDAPQPLTSRLQGLKADQVPYRTAAFLNEHYLVRGKVSERLLRETAPSAAAAIFAHVRALVLQRLYGPVPQPPGGLREFVEVNVDFFTQQPQWGYLSAEDQSYLFLEGLPTVIETVDEEAPRSESVPGAAEVTEDGSRGRESCGRPSGNARDVDLSRRGVKFIVEVRPRLEARMKAPPVRR